MIRSFVMVLVLWLALPATANAHLVNTGLGPFYDGVVHLFVSPEDLLPVIALALIAGLQGPQSGRAVLFVLPLAWLIGSFIGQAIANSICPPAVIAILTFALGALAAADLKLPMALLVVCAVALGVLHGGITGAELASQRAIALTPIGAAASVFFVVALVAGQVTTIRSATGRIVVRVAGSWIAAIGLLMFGWTMHA